MPASYKVHRPYSGKDKGWGSKIRGHFGESKSKGCKSFLRHTYINMYTCVHLSTDLGVISYFATAPVLALRTCSEEAPRFVDWAIRIAASDKGRLSRLLEFAVSKFNHHAAQPKKYHPQRPTTS